MTKAITRKGAEKLLAFSAEIERLLEHLDSISGWYYSKPYKQLAPEEKDRCWRELRTFVDDWIKDIEI